MKKSLLIIILSLFAFNLFGQKNAPEIIHRQHIVNVGSGIGFISKYDAIPVKPLLLVGYDYKAGFDLKRISSSKLYYSLGARFTNQFAQNTFLNENLMYLNIPVGFTLERKYNSKLNYNIQFGGNTYFKINNDKVYTKYFSDVYLGFGATFNERFGIDFRYNCLGNGINYMGLVGETRSFGNNTCVLILNYIIHQSSRENHRRWWF